MQYTPAEARPKEGSAAGAKAAAVPMTVAATAERIILQGLEIVKQI